MSFENYEANGYEHDFGFANHLALSACFLSYGKWLQREKLSNNTRLPFQRTTLINKSIVQICFKVATSNLLCNLIKLLKK